MITGKEMLNRRTLIGLAGAVLLALLFWFGGPLVAIADLRPLDPVWVRSMLALLIVGGWLGLEAWRLIRLRRANAALVNAVVDAGTPAMAVQEELDQLRDRLADAVTRLRRSAGKGRGNGLYQLPWYLLIGMPGSGKTTALTRSSLLAPTAGARPGLRGTGGTRDCEWIFTEQAVLLDTAGRYTSQDSHQERDSAGWLGFLDLLRRTRPQQPINGVIVAISVADLAQSSPEELSGHAARIRSRLTELTERFGTRIPTYLLFTKADLIEGFTAFFGMMERVELEQVWGDTLPVPDFGAPSEPVRISAAFDGLVERLRQRSLDRVQQEEDPMRRAQILAFPQQIASLRDAAEHLVTEMFKGSRFDALPLFRGFYLSSGAQVGTPIDRVTTAVTRRLGLLQSVGHAATTQRSYFLTRLLADVIFAEAWLGAHDPVGEKRRRRVRGAAYGLAILAGLALSLAWGVSYSANRTHMAGIDTMADHYADRLAQVPTPAASPQIEAILPVLDDIARMATAPEAGLLASRGLGLNQDRKLVAAAGLAYAAGLQGLLRPRLLLRLEQVMRRNRGDGACLYESLKIYLLLAGRDAMDAGRVVEWARGDGVPCPQGLAPLPDAAIAHVEALTAIPSDPVGIDEALVAQVRAALASTRPADYAFALLQRNPAIRALPAFNALVAGGPLTAQVLASASNRPLSAAVPGLYTKAGYRNAVLPALATLSAALSREQWVMGGTTAVTDDATLQREVQQLYLSEYSQTWKRLLADFVLAPVNGLDDQTRLLSNLAGTASPLSGLLRAVADETRLAADLPPQPVPPPEKQVDDAFADLHRYVLAESGTSLAGTLRLIADLDNQARGVGNPTASRALLAEARRLPPAVAGLVQQVARTGGAAAGDDVRGQLAGQWASQVLPTCRMVTEGLYPHRRGAEAEVPLTDFARLFGPGGLIDDFFKTHLLRFVDMSGGTWRWQAVDGVTLAVPPSALVEFERAARIRDAFFPGPGAPLVRFDLIPRGLTGNATQAVLEVDGQTVVQGVTGGPPLSMQWPGPGVGQARLTSSPDNGAVGFDGTWALFRLIDQAQRRASARADRVDLTFAIPGGSSRFELRPTSLNHPFRLPDLSDFRCPAAL